MKYKLGIEAKDKVTGFKGIIMGYAQYLTGCDQYVIQPLCDEKKLGDYPDSSWFDEGRIETLKKKRTVTAKKVAGKKKGCDYSAPKK